MKYIFIFLMLVPISLFSQMTISGTFSPAEEYKYVFLYRATPTATDFIARSEVDSIGRFSIDMESDAKPGIYKIVYAMPPERYNFNVIYSGKEDINIDYSIDKGLSFNESEENKLWASYTKSLEMINSTLSNFYAKGNKDEVALKKIFKTLDDTQNAYETNSQGMLVNKLIFANSPYVPDSFISPAEYAKNLANSYLDNVDFKDQLLQSSDFLSDRVIAYMFGANLESSNDHLKKKLNHLDEKLKGVAPMVKLQLLFPVWQKFSNEYNDELAIYMIDQNLLSSAKEAKDPMLAKTFENYKNTAIGKKAINFEVSSKAGENTLYDLNGHDYYLVIFWSSTCNHCLEELPIVKSVLSGREDIRVVAFAIEDDDSSWKEEIKKYPSFLHVMGLNKWENEVVKDYNIHATPSYFFLEADKTIKAKPFDAKALEAYLQSL